MKFNEEELLETISLCQEKIAELQRPTNCEQKAIQEQQLKAAFKTMYNNNTPKLMEWFMKHGDASEVEVSSEENYDRHGSITYYSTPWMRSRNIIFYKVSFVKTSCYRVFRSGKEYNSLEASIGPIAELEDLESLELSEVELVDAIYSLIHLDEYGEFFN